MRFPTVPAGASPHWSHDGTRIVYASTMGGNLDGRLERGATDLYTVPFGNGNGGPAAPLAGAAETSHEEYYPAFAPDDRLVAFNRVPAGEKMYANPNAELFVVPAGGGTAHRLKANDPPACSNRRSPGINNHWPKWAPAGQLVAGKTYYWLIFSSNRADIPPVPSTYANPAMPAGSLVQVSQLYVTAVVQDASGAIESFPAIYLWNQPTTTLNTTPVWENLEIPRVIE